MNVDKSWLEEYNKKKSIMCPENSLEKYFTDSEIAGCKIDTLEFGTLKITSGDIVACDPTACLDHNISPFFDKFPTGEFKVTASIVVDEQEEMDSKIAVVRIKFTDNAPVTYREALYGNEDLSEELTQETFAIAVKEIGKFKGNCKVSVWLCQIAKNLWYDECRKHQKAIKMNEENFLETQVSNDVTEEKVVQNEEKMALMNKLEQLSIKVIIRDDDMDALNKEIDQTINQ